MTLPTEWTYDGKINWASADTLRLSPYQDIILTITEALKERSKALGSLGLLPVILTDDYNQLLPVKSYADAIQSVVSYFFNSSYENYINYGEHVNGDFTGEEIFPLKWSQAAALIAIGDESRLSVTKLSANIKDWFFQQYQILNLMKYILTINSIKIEVYRDHKHGSGTGSSPSEAWGNAIDDYNSNEWGYTTYNYINAECAISYYEYNDEHYNATVHYPRRYRDLKITNNALIDGAVDIYFKGYKFPDDETSKFYFYQAIPGALEDKYFLLVQNQTVPIGETVNYGNIEPSLSSQPPTPPSTDGARRVYTYQTENQQIVFKPDFKFKNW